MTPSHSALPLATLATTSVAPAFAYACAFLATRYAKKTPLGVVVAASAVALFGALGHLAAFSLLLAFSPELAAKPLFGGAVLVDLASVAMLVLVSLVGIAVARFSVSYLRDEPDQARYARALAQVLAAVLTLVVSNHLIIVALAWLVASLGLHELLTFFSQRRQARVAAQKKFVVSRLADVCAALALLLLALRDPSLLRIDALRAAFAQFDPGHAPRATLTVEVAAGLLALAACLKTAQMPFHGWLTEIMEAPTPVSALLHAGIVNLGGYVLLRVAPFISATTSGPVVLLGFGLPTAILGAWAATRQATNKGALAWSTIAQMGFLIIECGAGLWHLALLHLVAHSLYKAHAFLSAGGVVLQWRARARFTRPTIDGLSLAKASLVSSLWMAVALYAAQQKGVSLPLGEAALLLVVAGLCVGPALASAWHVPGRVRWVPVARTVAFIGISLTLHVAAATATRAWLFPTARDGQANDALLIGLAAVFALVFTGFTIAHRAPHGRWSTALSATIAPLFALEERFSGLALRWLPPQDAVPAWSTRKEQEVSQ